MHGTPSSAADTAATATCGWGKTPTRGTDRRPDQWSAGSCVVWSQADARWSARRRASRWNLPSRLRRRSTISARGPECGVRPSSVRVGARAARAASTSRRGADCAVVDACVLLFPAGWGCRLPATFPLTRTPKRAARPNRGTGEGSSPWTPRGPDERAVQLASRRRSVGLSVALAGGWCYVRDLVMPYSDQDKVGFAAWLAGDGFAEHLVPAPARTPDRAVGLWGGSPGPLPATRGSFRGPARRSFRGGLGETPPAGGYPHVRSWTCLAHSEQAC